MSFRKHRPESSLVGITNRTMGGKIMRPVRRNGAVSECIQCTKLDQRKEGLNSSYIGDTCNNPPTKKRRPIKTLYHDSIADNRSFPLVTWSFSTPCVSKHHHRYHKNVIQRQTNSKQKPKDLEQPNVWHKPRYNAKIQPLCIAKAPQPTNWGISQQHGTHTDIA